MPWSVWKQPGISLDSKSVERGVKNVLYLTNIGNDGLFEHKHWTKLEQYSYKKLFSEGIHYNKRKIQCRYSSLNIMKL